MPIEIRRSLPGDICYAKNISKITHQETNVGILSTPEVGGLLARQRGFLAINTANEELAGFCLYPQITQGWSTPRTLAVLPLYRGNGYGYQLLSNAVEQCQDDNLLAVTKEPSVERMLNKLGFQPIQWTDLPLLVLLAYSKMIFVNRSFFQQLCRNTQNAGDYQYFARFSQTR